MCVYVCACVYLGLCMYVCVATVHKYLDIVLALKYVDGWFICLYSIYQFLQYCLKYSFSYLGLSH